MIVSSRLLFLAAWIFPTFCLVGGGLPPERIVAAIYAATLSGVLIAALPVNGFRIARMLCVLLFPLVWLWMCYAALDGMGPSAIDVIATTSNTNPTETWTALRLGITFESSIFGLLSLALLVASFARGVPPPSRRSGATFATSMLVLMVTAWLPRVLANAPAVLPGRDDLQNFPYGSLADVAATLADGSNVLAPQHAVHRKPAEPHVAAGVNSIFILGETFRFGPFAELTKYGPGGSFFAERFKDGLGVFLPKVCASADATAISVPMLLTGTSPEFHDGASTAPSGLARLASAGYQTAWISNQDLQFFTDEKRDMVWVSNGLANRYDEALVPVATNVLSSSSQKNKGLLLHLMDSHADYVERYPTMSEPGGLSLEQQDTLRYERANDHTLLVLQNIARLIDRSDTPTFAIYVSDHGENLLADHNGIRFHAGPRTTVEAAYVPAIVFWNEAFGRKYSPGERLQKFIAAPVLAHADIYRLWMSFSGLPADLTPTSEPMILGKARLTDQVGAIPCGRLSF